MEQHSTSRSSDGRFPAPVSHRNARSDPSQYASVGMQSGEPYMQSTSETCVLKKTFPNGHSYIGTWLDGRMHGEGLYVWQDGSEYKGDFHSDIMSGRGEKRWPDGRCYRGTWKQDMMWGEGEMTWPTGEHFAGQFCKGAFHGHGVRTKPSGDTYVGDFNNGEQEGEGTFRSAIEGWVFVGLWLHGRMYGEGRVEWPDGTAYVGQWKDGIRDGHGQLTWPDGAWYEGPFSGNHVEGLGLKSFPDGSYYEGEFADGEFEGHGKFHWPDGTEFEGLWNGSEIVGPGCHRFPNGTTIKGTFAECGASGEGQKEWTNGCVYNGVLQQNIIDQYGTLRWPDGRCYVGQLDDGALQGEGSLVWTEKGIECKYSGQFSHNLFEGRGVLEWSTGSRYEGTFHDGHYHGEGSFEWPGQRSAYRGQWVHGEMCGTGTLTCAVSGGPDQRVRLSGGTDQRYVDMIREYVYTGAFKHGHMDGKGHVAFKMEKGGQDEYRGKFKGSKFNGRGTFMWNDRASLTGLFEDNYCNRVGRKVYPDGREYTGELRYDLEHGKGIVAEAQKKRFVGIWDHGNVVEELFDSCAPEVDMKLAPCQDSTDDEAEPQGAGFGGSGGAPSEARPGSRPLLPICDESGRPVCGRAIVTFLNGDKYVGYMKGGRKNGRGMYVYGDLTMYRGVWSEDMLEGIRHPVTEDPLPVKVKHLVRAVEDESELSPLVSRGASPNNLVRAGTPDQLAATPASSVRRSAYQPAGGPNIDLLYC